MSVAPLVVPEALAASPVRVIFAEGALDRLGEEVRALGGGRALLVTDPGIAAAGHVARATDSMRAASVSVTVFDGVEENPTEKHIEAGLKAAGRKGLDVIVGLGGGSAMDCAKGINLLLSNGGAIADYQGTHRALRALIPMVAVPTTAGTGSEAQSFALISDSQTHRKMACGDRRPPQEGGLRPHVAILDAELTATVPRTVAVTVAIDAVSHAVETAGTRVRNRDSLCFSRLAWDYLNAGLDAVLDGRPDGQARGRMLIGAHLAGAAIECSMLGAAHACANPLTARLGITHGIAVGMMLPSVVRFNTAGGVNHYEALGLEPPDLARRLESWLDRAGLPTSAAASPRADDIGRCLDQLAADAAEQWTAQFNPVPITSDVTRLIYEMSLGIDHAA